VQKKPDTKSDWTAKTETGFPKRKSKKTSSAMAAATRRERERERERENCGKILRQTCIVLYAKKTPAMPDAGHGR
jgi:hypothetical protein